MASSAENNRTVFKPLTESSLKLILTDAKEIKLPPPNKELRDGNILPKKYKEFQAQTMACVPLEEIDPAYKNLKTFVVIGKKGTIHRYSARNSLATLSPVSPIRKWAIYSTTHWAFSLFMVSVVLLNTIFLANERSRLFDHTATIIYALELVLKIISEGLMRDSFSYLRKPWNWLDVVVILTSLIRPLRDISVLQWIRVLKIIHLIPEVRRSFHYVMKSVVKLRAALVLTAFTIFIFAIIGMHLFMGTLTQRCIKIPIPLELELLELELELNDSNEYNSSDTNESDESEETPFEIFASNSSNWFSNELCQLNKNKGCPEDYQCVYGYGRNPDYGFTNFDSIGWALIHTVRIIDQDYLENILYQLTKANGSIPIIYFVAIFFFGTYALGTFAYSLLGNYIFEILDKVKKEDEDASAEDSVQTQTTSSTLGSRPEHDHYRILAQNTMNSYSFETFITCTIILDIIALSLVHDHMTASEINIMHWIFGLVLILYTFEFIVKVYALGPKAYFTRGWNIFDFIVLLDFFFQLIFEGYNVPFPFRIFKITPRWTTLNLTFQILTFSVKTLYGFAGLLLTFWAYFSLVGTSEFKEHYFDNIELFENEELSRWSFTDFFHSAMIVFRSWIGESIEVLQDCLVVSDCQCLVYFSIVALSGCLILMILTVGVIYATDRTLTATHNIRQEPSTLSRMFSTPCEWILSKIKQLFPKSKPICGNEDPLLGDKQRVACSPPLGGSKVLKGVSIFIIIVGSLILTLDNVPNADDNDIQSLVYAVDVVFTIFFTIMSIYMLVVVGVKDCISSPGWIFDVLVILEMILNVIYELNANPYPYPMFYLLRSFRPFMLVSRIERLEIVLRGLIEELKFLWRFMLVGAFIWLSFAILGTDMFSGSFSKCTDSEDGSLINSTFVTDKEECLALNFTWTNSDLNFDHIGKSFVSLVLVGKRNSWITILHDTFDFYSADMNFQREHDLSNFYYFLAFFICGIFLVANIIFGVMYYNLKQFSEMFLTAEQIKEAHKSSSTEYQTQPPQYPVPNGEYRKNAYNVVTDHKFGILIMFLIILDIFLLSLDSFVSPLDYESKDGSKKEAIMWLRLIILWFYLIELILKLVTCGKAYFSSGWNRLDFIVVMFSLLDWLLVEFAVESWNFGFFRMFRILRVFQFQPFISRAKMICLYFQAFSRVKIAFKNILIFHILIMYSYCLLGISKFGNVELAKGLDSFYNFHKVSSSMRVLFMLSSMAGVDGILPVLTQDIVCIEEDEEGVEFEDGDCGNLFWGTLFVFSYTFISFLNFMNLYFLFSIEIIEQIKTRITAKCKLDVNSEHNDPIELDDDESPNSA